MPITAIDKWGKPIDLGAAMELFVSDPEYKRVGWYEHGDVALVSTVWLPFDHGNPAGPLYFETMIFWEDDRYPEQYRYPDLASARAGHALAVGFVRIVRPLTALPPRTLRENCQ